MRIRKKKVRIAIRVKGIILCFVSVNCMRVIYVYSNINYLLENVGSMFSFAHFWHEFRSRPCFTVELRAFLFYSVWFRSIESLTVTVFEERHFVVSLTRREGYSFDRPLFPLMSCVRATCRPSSFFYKMHCSKTDMTKLM